MHGSQERRGLNWAEAFPGLAHLQKQRVFALSLPSVTPRPLNTARVHNEGGKRQAWEGALARGLCHSPKEGAGAHGHSQINKPCVTAKHRKSIVACVSRGAGQAPGWLTKATWWSAMQP